MHPSSPITISNMTDLPDQDFSGLNVRGLNRVVLELYRASGEAAFGRFQPLALELVQEIIPFDSAWWGNAAADSTEIHHLYLYNCDDSILDAYLPFLERDFFRAALIAHPGVTINMADLTTRARFVRSELYRKVGKRYQIEWSLGTLLVEPVSSLYEFLTLWRHDPKHPFTEVERRTKELLMPHLAQAHRVARLRGVLDDTRKPRMVWAVADERGFLREVTPGFIHALRAHWPDWQGSRLPTGLLECVCAGQSCHTGPVKIDITLKGRFRYLEIRATSPLDRLSPREREIAQRYARGETYTAIARALAISPATVRNHLAHCYRKLAVNNKAELSLLHP